MSAALWTTKRPEVKRTYQSKFKLNKGPSLAESLLNRAVWAFDALWSSTAATPAASSDPHGAVRKSLSTSPDLVDEDDFAVSFGRLSIAKVQLFSVTRVPSRRHCLFVAAHCPISKIFDQPSVYFY